MLVPPADPARLSQAITALARDPAERQELSRSASEFAKSLEWSSIAQRTLDLYRELVENAHADRH